MFYAWFDTFRAADDKDKVQISPLESNKMMNNDQLPYLFVFAGF